MVTLKAGELVTPTGRLVLPAGKLGSEDWLAYRRWRKDVPGGYCIGSSDVPSILDLDGVDTPAHVYRNKVMDIRTEPNEPMLWGHLFENTIAEEWCRRNRAVIDEIGLVAREGTPWHQCTIDRRVRECPVYRGRGEKRECGLEVKHVEFVSASRWHTDWGIPERIIAQIAHQIYVTGYDHMHYAAKVPGGFKQGIIYADREAKLIDFIVREVEKFRTEHLIAKVEPPWNISKPDKMIALDNATHPEREGEVELDLDGIGAVMEYAEAAARAGAWEKKRKQAAAEVRRIANGASLGKFSGQRAFWYGEGHRTNTDLDALKEGWPQVYDQVVTEKEFPVLHVDKAYKPKGGAE